MQLAPFGALAGAPQLRTYTLEKERTMLFGLILAGVMLVYLGYALRILLSVL